MEQAHEPGGHGGAAAAVSPEETCHVVVTMHPSCGSPTHELQLQADRGPADGADSTPLLVMHLMEALAVSSGCPVWRQRLFIGGELLGAGQALSDLAADGVLAVEMVPRRGRQRQADPARLHQWAADARARVAGEGLKRGGG
eukprot:COSAG02_NODE_227_length_28153_cov_11.662294_21_plen_142_part_00